MASLRTGQRSRAGLVAELYERHAAGLFAYCHDQLGETTSAADAVVAVFTGLPFAEPPRAVLYALARREIYRRDVSYALPAVDPVADPATALIERVFRDIRPHQREVLLLSAVCGLTTSELSLVLEVAADTAEELTTAARNRFTQTLATAVSAARSAPYLPFDVAEVYDAIDVAPIEDILARLPWRRPPATVRDRVLSSLPYEEPGAAAAPPLPIKRLWPTAPTWPLPLSAPDQISNTCVVRAEAITSAKPRRRAKHEATTEPMPKLRLLSALGESRLRRRRTGGAPARATDQASTPARPQAELPSAETAVTPSVPEPVAAPDSDPDTAPFDAFRPAEPDDPAAKEPSARRTRAGRGAQSPDADDTARVATRGESNKPARRARSAAAAGKTHAVPDTPARQRRRSKRARNRDRHYDWAWELIGLLICLAFALLVFYLVPSMV